MGVVVATCGIKKHLGRDASIAKSVSQQSEQGNACALGYNIPNRHVQNTDGHRSFSVASWFLVFHEHLPDSEGIEIFAGAIYDTFGFCGFEPRNKALAQQAARSITPIGVEAEANNSLSFAANIGNDRQHADVHLAEIDVGV